MTIDINMVVAIISSDRSLSVVVFLEEGGLWDVIWRLADQPGAYYIKIDDDVTFIANGALAEIIRGKKEALLKHRIFTSVVIGQKPRLGVRVFFFRKIMSWFLSVYGYDRCFYGESFHMGEKRRERFLFVSANVVNHGILSAVHQEQAIMPHLEKPE